MMTNTAFQLEWDSADMLALYFDEKPKAWNKRVLGDLTDVATLLDCLEVWEVSERKVYTRSDGTFLVKWRD